MKPLTKLTEKVRKGEGGFTLIEVLIVILILAILVATVVFNVGGFIGVGTDEVAKMQGNVLQTAIVAATAVESSSNVAAGSIGDNGTSITNPDDWILKVGDTDIVMSKYVQNNITGYWEWDDNGTITKAEYSGVAKTCTYNGINWTCS